MNIPKVGEEEEKINTKVNKIPVTAIENQKRHSVRAIGIPCISDEITSIHILSMWHVLSSSLASLTIKFGVEKDQWIYWLQLTMLTCIQA